MKNVTRIIRLILFICAVQLYAQSNNNSLEPPMRWGGFFHLSANFHSADFRALPGVPNCCPKFESATGTGISVGGLFDIPFDSKMLLEIRADYSTQGALLKRTETAWLGLDNSGVLGEFEHSVDAKLSTFGISGLFGYKLLPELTLLAGPRFGFAVQKTYSQKEKIVSPSDRGYFIGTDSSRVRNVNSGDIPEASSLWIGAEIGARYEMPLNRKGNLFIAPEVFFRAALTPVVSGYSWSVHSLHGGISIIYNIPPGEPKKPEPVKIEIAENRPEPVKQTAKTPAKTEINIEKPKKEPVLKAKLTAVGADNSVEQPGVKVGIEEFLSISMRPLLTYVFFDDNSSELPSRYKRLKKDKTASFKVNSLYNVSTMPTYYNLLNVVGSRMNDKPKTKIRLVGCNSGAGDERNNLELSRKRAESVKNYLVEIWGIAPERISVQSRNLPATPSTQDAEDGIQENRRVEIYSDNDEITSPVITNDTLREVSPKIIRFRPEVTAEKGLDSWKISARQNGKLLKEIQGGGTVPEIIDWTVNSEKESVPQNGSPIEYFMEVTDNDGRTAKSPEGELQVNQKTVKQKSLEQTADKRIDRYGIILFEFDKPALNSEQIKQVKYIKDKIEAGSKVKITGYADRMGDEDHNRKLSLDRAKSMARALKADNAEVSGAGNSVELYDNSLPEGRFYCRTVEVIVETPIKE